MAGRRGHGNPAGDFRPAHQQLHAHEGAEGVAGNPQAAMARVYHLHPVQRGRGIADFANAAVIAALATAHATEVEAHDREAKLLEALIHRVGNTVVHRAAMQRMWVHDQRQRRTRFLAMVVTTFQAPVWAGEHHLRH